MATSISGMLAGRGRRRGGIAVTGYDRLLAGAAALLFAAALAAVARGHADWPLVPPVIWLHLVTILAATGLTPVMLLGRRGTRRHRLLGRAWVVAMTATAALSLGIRVLHPGHWSLIHLLSIWVLLQAPLIWWSAATGRIEQHRATVRAMVTGALVIAGFFTFPFDRLLGHWLFA